MVKEKRKERSKRETKSNGGRKERKINDQTSRNNVKGGNRIFIM